MKRRNQKTVDRLVAEARTKALHLAAEACANVQFDAMYAPITRGTPKKRREGEVLGAAECERRIRAMAQLPTGEEKAECPPEK